jgi:hydrogenase nickel incorporation protein HypB
MADIRRIAVQEAVHGENDRIAEDVRERITRRGVFMVNVMGAPGAGKTSTIVSTVKHFKTSRPYVVEGDIESDLDARTMRALGIETIQINTGGACHLDAPLVAAAVQELSLDAKGILFVENIGNLVCPAEFTIGEHAILLVSTVTEGSDKPYKYPLAFEKASAVVLNKCDLLPYVDFDEAFFLKGLRALNPTAPVFKVSARTGEGFAEVAAWLESRAGA